MSLRKDISAIDRALAKPNPVAARVLRGSDFAARMAADQKFRAKIERGLADAAAGRTIPIDVLKRRLGDP